MIGNFINLVQTSLIQTHFYSCTIQCCFSDDQWKKRYIATANLCKWYIFIGIFSILNAFKITCKLQCWDWISDLEQGDIDRQLTGFTIVHGHGNYFILFIYLFFFFWGGGGARVGGGGWRWGVEAVLPVTFMYKPTTLLSVEIAGATATKTLVQS